MTILFFSSSSFSFDFFLRLFLFLFFFGVYLAYGMPMISGMLELGKFVCKLSVSLLLDMYRTWG
jgi:hypothetical protein